MCIFFPSLPPGSFVFALLGGVRVNNVCSKTLKIARKRQVLSKIHLITKWSCVLSLDACVVQQRLENNLRGENSYQCTEQKQGYSEERF